MFDFTGKYAVVTGGSQGIGEAIVRCLMADGAAGVAVLDMADVPYTGELDPSGGRLFALKCNVAHREGARAAIQQVYEKFGRIDFMINNAGIARDAMFHKMSDDNWDSVVGVDLNGAYHCTREVINPMREQEYGRIIFISSIAVYGAVGQSNYAAAKGGLYAMTKTLAREERRKNITVNCIVPGGIETAMTANLPKGGDGPGLGKPEQVASLICYLCTDEAAYINGACIDINGGVH
ncbi:MAG: SDR family NAD(P)-dependent oxidoreductase [Clostridiales bacterium]|nr:SDR family NAD(P)-dependent oxidoreductase [Clostridiales bacterium]